MRFARILLVTLSVTWMSADAQKSADQRVRIHVQKAVAGVLKPYQSAPPGKKHAQDAARQADVARLAVVLDCVEERIEQHNRLQPATPWADIRDIRRQVGGDPPRNKNLRACPGILKQLKSFFPTGH